MSLESRCQILPFPVSDRLYLGKLHRTVPCLRPVLGLLDRTDPGRRGLFEEVFAQAMMFLPRLPAMSEGEARQMVAEALADDTAVDGELIRQEFLLLACRDEWLAGRWNRLVLERLSERPSGDHRDLRVYLALVARLLRLDRERRHAALLGTAS
ncbi:hypothetical protein AMJ57_00070 [Parcubacteria bacterium SG8_24]|nr:MAG: hypothetical protein AMJ57_00070 [Parcubacteria bacterium SG8_24]